MNLLILILSIYGLLVIPIYSKIYGIHNFLWLSDIGFFGTIIALWLNSNLLLSIVAVLVWAMEILWIVDFVWYAVFGYSFCYLADYMFDKKYSLFLRSLSLFHILMPILWIISLVQYGYDPGALFYAIPLYWIILLLTYNFTSPQENINWVFAPQKYLWKISQKNWFLILFFSYPLLIILPTHVLFMWLF